jgi:hypothetical protein
MTAWLVAAAAAFNLVCTGTVTTWSKTQPPKDQPWEDVFRVDLESQRWCRGHCEETRPIDRMTDTELVLTSRLPLEGVTLKINRESGRLTETYRMDDFQTLGKAVCKREDFGGFPRPLF